MTAIAIFVKTPGHSPVKSRLAAGIGTDRAEQWHLQAAHTVAALAQHADIGPVYWAVAEGDALDDSNWSGLPVLAQNQGGLGQRMAGVHTRLVRRHGSALLLGADAPQWRPEWLQQAAEWLRHEAPRLCLGPARDGGFWTFGANRVLPDADWTAVNYSQASTGADFRRRMDRHGRWLDLPRLTDLDTIDDLPALIRELERVDQPSRQQATLLAWLKRMAIS